MEWVRVGLSRLGLPWRPQRKSAAPVGVGFIVVAALTFFSRETRLDLKQSKDCHFPAIFNFGDSNSDTGTVSAAFGRVPFPNGITFFGRPSGRYLFKWKEKKSRMLSEFHQQILYLKVERLPEKVQPSELGGKHQLLVSNTGFPLPLQICCGKIGIVDCGYKKMVNGTEVHGDSCNDPSTYVSWDGIHYTEAANKWVASKILDGSFSEPKVSIAEACQRLSPPP